MPPLPLWIHPLAELTAVLAFFLILAGGLVTSTGSSLAVPDWPLSFGQFFPRMEGGVFFEHGHRVIAGLVAILACALALGLRLKETRAWVKSLAYAAAGAILLQALLGGITVLWGLPHPVSIAHACLGQAVFCLLLALAQATSPWYAGSAPEPAESGLWKAGAWALGAVYLQILWGALVRHARSGLWLHFLWAFAASATLGNLLYQTWARGGDRAALARPALMLAFLLPLQWFLGFESFRARFVLDLGRAINFSAALTACHVAAGALILGTCVIWTLRSLRQP